MPILNEVNHRPESRMRENRQYGSEGGETGQPVFPTPITSVSNWALSSNSQSPRQIKDSNRRMEAQGVASVCGAGASPVILRGR